MKILAFAGSLREGSWNKKLLRQGADILTQMGHEIEVYDLAPLPLINEDLEKGGLPEAVASFRAKVEAANALLIATPEYNYSIATPAKNAVDWLSRPPRNVLAGKVAAVMGATIGMHGTINAQRELRWVLSKLDCLVVTSPEIMVFTAPKSFDADGRLMDEKQAKSLEGLMKALVEIAGKLE